MIVVTNWLYDNLLFPIQILSIDMFATENYVQARRGTKGTPRFEYLQKLVTEYQDTTKLGTFFNQSIYRVSTTNYC